jgi:hypothetical protein
MWNLCDLEHGSHIARESCFQTLQRLCSRGKLVLLHQDQVDLHIGKYIYVHIIVPYFFIKFDFFSRFFGF